MGGDVTVSIVNHENRDALLRSLEALPGLEVIVVDNASTDGSVEAVRAAFGDVSVVARRYRAGYGANHNVALRRSSRPYVLLLNDDVRVRPGAVAALAAALDGDPRVAVAAPTVVGPDDAVEPTLWPAPSLAEDIRTALRLGRARSVAAGETIGWATGCALMVRRDAALGLGGFDEGYFMYSEEIDLCTRLRAAGHRIAAVSDAVVEHRGQLSTGVDSAPRAVEMARSRRRYWRLHYPPWARAVARTVASLQFLAMAASGLLRRRAARPLLLQAAVCIRDPGRPGLREQADAFNRALG
jgi:GT2 family glycosyltransferase